MLQNASADAPDSGVWRDLNQITTIEISTYMSCTIYYIHCAYSNVIKIKSN